VVQHVQKSFRREYQVELPQAPIMGLLLMTFQGRASMAAAFLGRCQPG